MRHHFAKTVLFSALITLAASIQMASASNLAKYANIPISIPRADPPSTATFANLTQKPVMLLTIANNTPGVSLIYSSQPGQSFSSVFTFPSIPQGTLTFNQTNDFPGNSNVALQVEAIFTFVDSGTTQQSSALLLNTPPPASGLVTVSTNLQARNASGNWFVMGTPPTPISTNFQLKSLVISFFNNLPNTIHATFSNQSLNGVPIVLDPVDNFSTSFVQQFGLIK